MTTPRQIEWKGVDPLRHPTLFVNPRSGHGVGPRIAQEARNRGITVVEFGPDQALGPQVDEAVAAGADALAVAGGDGSLARVAQVALARDLPFVCIPAGTRNHFARDLGLDPADPLAALDALSDGVEGLIDVGEVNGSIFLNNVSLGIYADAVSHSEYRDAKVRTLIETARGVLGPGAEVSGLEVVDDLGTSHIDPAIVLVSNNPYAFGGPPARGARPTLCSGQIGTIVIDRPVAGRMPSGRAWSSASLQVKGPDTVHAGIDGEAVELAPPLDFAVRPAALRVRVSDRSRAARGNAQERLLPTAPVPPR